VLVVDLQTGMFDGVAFPPIHGAAALVDYAQAVIQWARRTGRRVAFIRHDGAEGEPLAPGSAGCPVWPALGQNASEPTFSKQVGDAFSDPALVAWAEGAQEIVILGARSEHCVAATVKGALARGFRVTVVADAHSTWNAGTETADEIIARQNAAFEAAGARVKMARALSGD